MSTYGYMFKSVSTYNTVREDSRPFIKPFVPFVPNSSSGNSEGYVTKKTIVPVSSRPNGDDDYKKHSYPSEVYPARGDDEYHREKSPVYGSPRKVDDFISKVHNEASRPRFSPAVPTDWRQSPHQPTYGGGDYGSNKEGRKPIGGAYDRTNGYGDYGNYGGNKEGHKPIGGTIRNDHNYDRHNGTDGYGGDYGNYGDKEGRKPAVSTIRNGSYNGPNGYGGYNNKEGHRPTSSPHKYDGHDGGSHGYGDYKDKEGHRPTSSPHKYDDYDGANNGYGGGYGNHNNKEGHRPVSSLKYNDGANNGYGGGYGNHNNKEGHRPISSPVHGYDGANNGYNNKEGHRPFGSIPRNDSYGSYNGGNGYGGDYGGYNNNHNKIIPGGGINKPVWTAPPRKGTQLSEPTSDIGKAMELLKVAANVTSNNKHDGAADRSSAPSNNWASSLINGSPLGDAKGKYDKGMELVKETERLKKIATGDSPKPATPTRDDATRYGNFNLSYRPRTPPKHVSFVDGGRDVYDGDDYREDSHHRRSYGNASPVMDSRYAENVYGGARV